MIRRAWTWLLDPPVTGPRATMVIRLMAGGVFFWEGILKFVYANQGVGRFTKLGLPFPVFTANFVGGLEIVGGLLLILGLGTRLITIPFIIEMLVAILSTKPRLFLGTLPLPPPPVPPAGWFARPNSAAISSGSVISLSGLICCPLSPTTRIRERRWPTG